MYLALAAAQEGAVLELAAGSGRICVPLAAAGHRVTGVDNDRAMLDRARSAWERRQTAGDVAANGALELVEADITRLTLSRRFGLVVLALNSLLLLTARAARLRALEVIRRHLAPDGRAVIDVWLPTKDDLELYDGRLMLDWIRRDPETGATVDKSWSARYDAATGLATITTHLDVHRRGVAAEHIVREDKVRFLSRAELVAEVESAGLSVESAFEDYESVVQDNESATPDHATTALRDDAERIVLIVRAATASAGLR